MPTCAGMTMWKRPLRHVEHLFPGESLVSPNGSRRPRGDTNPSAVGLEACRSVLAWHHRSAGVRVAGEVVGYVADAVVWQCRLEAGAQDNPSSHVREANQWSGRKHRISRRSF
jgi:hypothetical protein